MKRHFFTYFFILLILFTNSCSKRSIPDKRKNKDIHSLEVKYVLENQAIHDEKILKERSDYALRYVLDTFQSARLFNFASDSQYLYQELKQFYDSIDYQLAWTSFERLLDRGSQFIGMLEDASRYGLDSDDYAIREIMDLHKLTFKQEAVDLYRLFVLDVYLSGQAILFARHLHSGRIDPKKIAEDWHIDPAQKDLSSGLIDALGAPDMKTGLEAFEPGYMEYDELKKRLLVYLKIFEEGGWPQLAFPSHDNLPQRGDTAEILTLVKGRLQLTGDMKGENAASAYFGEDLSLALRAFQRRLGMESNGELNAETIRELNIPIEQRLSTIRINLERFRWFPDPGDRHLMINIPEFMMTLVDSARVKMTSKVIVGKEVRPTPVFSESLEYIVVNPRWRAPTSIATEEMLPKIKEHKDFFKENNYILLDSWGEEADEVDPDTVDWSEISKENFPFVIEQASGADNALGKVKFMMPNRFAIYLHDTPAEYLFENQMRDFSHGCIRVERPFELARYLLKETPGWDENKLDSALQEEEPVEIYLPDSWPVYILYKTAWVDENGSLNFREDIYGYDEAQRAALKSTNINLTANLFPSINKSS